MRGYVLFAAYTPERHHETLTVLCLCRNIYTSVGYIYLGFRHTRHSECDGAFASLQDRFVVGYVYYVTWCAIYVVFSLLRGCGMCACVCVGASVFCLIFPLRQDSKKGVWVQRAVECYIQFIQFRQKDKGLYTCLNERKRPARRVKQTPTQNSL